MAPIALVAAGFVTIIAAVVIIALLVVYFLAIILQLRKITAGLNVVIGGVGEIVAKSAPVNGVVTTINANLDAGVDLLEGLLVKKAGIDDAVGLVDGLYPGAGAAGLRSFPDSGRIIPPRIGEVYTLGTLTLARLGREAPVAAASPAGGPVLRDVEYGSAAARALYPAGRPGRPTFLPRSPVIGTGSPVQYVPSEEPGARRHMPGGGTAVADPPPAPPAQVPPAPAPPVPAAAPTDAEPERTVLRPRRFQP
jgi:hypothetical protein